VFRHIEERESLRPAIMAQLDFHNILSMADKSKALGRQGAPRTG
jgi:hypothetical protein